MKKFSVKTIVAIVVGAALFFVLGRFVSIPSPIPDTTISIQYGVLAFVSVLFGPIAGFFTGLIGHFFIDFTKHLADGSTIWWSWIGASAFSGLVMGLAALKIHMESGEFEKKAIMYWRGWYLHRYLMCLCTRSRRARRLRKARSARPPMRWRQRWSEHFCVFHMQHPSHRKANELMRRWTFHRLCLCPANSSCIFYTLFNFYFCAFLSIHLFSSCAILKIQEIVFESGHGITAYLEGQDERTGCQSS